MNLATTLAGIELEHPLMNAGGTCKTLEDVERFARSAVAAVVVGPATPLLRLGNEGNIYWQGAYYSLNSLGMPNPGGDYYEQNLRRMVDIAHAAGKPLIFQIAGFSPADYVELAEIAESCGVKHIELNFGCPNVWDGGKQKGIVSFDPEAIAWIVKQVREVFYGTVGLKLSPYSDPELLAKVAETINELPLDVDYIACSNTFPNALVLDPETGKPVISVGNGLAGLSGLAMKPIALGQVCQFMALLETVDIVGVGGITRGIDIVDFQRAGAVAVQASTPYWNAGEDPGVYSELLKSLVDRIESNEGVPTPEER